MTKQAKIALIDTLIDMWFRDKVRYLPVEFVYERIEVTLH